jgi:hypothetical protein
LVEYPLLVILMDCGNIHHPFLMNKLFSTI